MKTKVALQPFGETQNEQRLKALKQIQMVLINKYRRRQPDPFKMPAYRLNREHELLWRLVGTTFMTKKLFERWLEVDRAFSSAVACEKTYPY